MFLSALAFSLMAVTVKYASSFVPTPEIMFFRTFVTVAVIMLFAATGKVDLKVRSKGKLAFRGIMGAITLLLYFNAISITTLSNAILLAYTYPVFAAIFSSIYLKESLSPKKIMFIMMAMIGIFMIFGFNFENANLGDLMALISGITNGMVITSIRDLRKTDSSWVIVFSFALTASVLSLPLMGFNFILPSFAILSILVILGLFGTIGQLFMTYAYKLCSTALGGVISLSSIVITVILSVFIFDEKLTLLMVAGGLLVFISAASFSTEEMLAVSQS